MTLEPWQVLVITGILLAKPATFAVLIWLYDSP